MEVEVKTGTSNKKCGLSKEARESIAGSDESMTCQHVGEEC